MIKPDVVANELLENPVINKSLSNLVLFLQDVIAAKSCKEESDGEAENTQ